MWIVDQGRLLSELLSGYPWVVDDLVGLYGTKEEAADAAAKHARREAGCGVRKLSDLADNGNGAILLLLGEGLVFKEQKTLCWFDRPTGRHEYKKGPEVTRFIRWYEATDALKTRAIEVVKRVSRSELAQYDEDGWSE